MLRRAFLTSAGLGAAVAATGIPAAAWATATAPAAPTWCSGSALTATSAKLEFTAGSDGGSPVTSNRWIATPADHSPLPALIDTTLANPFVYPGLTPGTTYQFYVEQTNAVGTSKASMSTPAIQLASDPWLDLCMPAGQLLASSCWTLSGVAAAPLHPNSAALVSEFNADVIASGGPGTNVAFNEAGSNTSFAVAAPGTPGVNMGFYDAQKKGYLDPTFAADLTDVPVPSFAAPAGTVNTDQEQTILDSDGNLWEFWLMMDNRNTALPGWSACWGGKTNVATCPGYFPKGYGASSSGLVVSAGMLGIRETQAAIAAGTGVGHALCVATNGIGPFTKYQWPAQSGDGSASSTSLINTGQWFRMDPTLDVSSISGLTSIGKVIMRTLQTFGMIVTDQDAYSPALIGESSKQITNSGQVDPWLAMNGTYITGGKSTPRPTYLLTQNIPWESLQALPAGWGQPA
jgi:hypothetical protein